MWSQLNDFFNVHHGAPSKLKIRTLFHTTVITNKKFIVLTNQKSVKKRVSIYYLMKLKYTKIL